MIRIKERFEDGLLPNAFVTIYQNNSLPRVGRGLLFEETFQSRKLTPYS